MNYKTALLLVSVLIPTLFASGCIDQIVPMNETNDEPDTSKYELEVFLDKTENDTFVNTTTFYLSTNQSVEAVHMVKNSKELDIVPIEELGGVDKSIISDVVVIAEYANNTQATIKNFKSLSERKVPLNINHTVTDDVVGGQKHIYIRFNKSITGFVAYTMDIPSKQDFTYNPTSPSIIRFVIPEGYSTGNPVIGRPRPSPNDKYYDDKGRLNLIWYNFEGDPASIFDRVRNFAGSDDSEEPQFSQDSVNVKFYPENAPLMLSIGSMGLSLGALVVVLYYRNERKKLKKEHEWLKELENENKR